MLKEERRTKRLINKKLEETDFEAKVVEEDGGYIIYESEISDLATISFAVSYDKARLYGLGSSEETNHLIKLGFKYMIE